MVTARYYSLADQNLKDAVLGLVQAGRLSGLGTFVVTILVHEAGFAENTAANRAMFRNVITEELQKGGVPEEVIFDVSRTAFKTT